MLTDTRFTLLSFDRAHAHRARSLARSLAPNPVRSLAPLLGLALALQAAGCARAADASGVRFVEAKIDGITCAACVPPLTKSLQRHFANATVAVDDASDTATLQLKSGPAFSPAAFRQAVTDVRMRITAVRLEACGRAEAAGAQRILDAGGSRFVLRGDQAVPLNQPVCVRGSLDSSQEPATLDVSAVTAPGSASAGS
jgi:hypothetical protein